MAMDDQPEHTGAFRLDAWTRARRFWSEVSTEAQAASVTSTRTRETLRANDEPLEDRSREWRRSAPHLVAFALLGTLLTLAETRRASFERLMQEDGWAEWATFLVLA
jgi:hypothetical protein